MAPQDNGSLARPSKFEATIAGYQVHGEYEGRLCRVTVRRRNGIVSASVVCDSRVCLWVEPGAEGTSPVVLPLPTAARTTVRTTIDESLDRLTKRTWLLDEKGEVEEAEVERLTEREFERATAGPPTQLVPVRSRKLPHGKCVEIYDHKGELCRTYWSSRFAARRAA